MQKLFGILLGLVSGIILIAIIQMISHLVFTMPDGLDVTSYGQWGQYLDQMPELALVAILLGWLCGSFVASYVATRSSKDISFFSAAVEGVLFTCGGVLIMLTAPYPAWMWIIGIACFIFGAVYGGRVAIEGSDR